MVVCHVNLASGFSGGERQTLELIKTQQKLGIKLLAVANPSSPLTKSLRELDLDVIAAGSFFEGHLNKSLKKSKLILHAHDGRSVHWCAIQKFFTGTPFVLTRRIDIPIKENFATKWSYSHADHQIAISSAIRKILEKQNPSVTASLIPSSPVSYTYEQEKIDQYRKQFGTESFIVIHAAKMLSHKAFDVTLQAAGLLSEKDPSIQILLLGDGPLQDEIKKQSLSLSNVHFLGKQNDMGNWFRVANTLILPSRTEGLGSVLLEAMIAGTPVIGSSVGGIPDIIKDKSTGLLIPPNDPLALAESIMKMKSDGLLRQNLIHGGHLLADSLSIENSAEKYISIYRNILEKS